MHHCHHRYMHWCGSYDCLSSLYSTLQRMPSRHVISATTLARVICCYSVPRSFDNFHNDFTNIATLHKQTQNNVIFLSLQFLQISIQNQTQNDKSRRKFVAKDTCSDSASGAFSAAQREPPDVGH